MQKTIRECLEMLPEPWRSQAIENTKEDVLDSLANGRHFLTSAFIFSKSTQGFRYWSEFMSKISPSWPSTPDNPYECDLSQFETEKE